MPRENTFHFKRFSLLNDRTAMKVGTDGVLLGAWCDVAGVERVLDVGTGCGLIALMVAQRNARCKVVGIDIDAAAVDEACFNIANSPWSDRVEALEADFNAYTPDGKYDLIVSNPPFFADGILAPDSSRMCARHMVELDIATLVKKSVSLLGDGGRLCLITPVDLEASILDACAEAGASLAKRTLVYTKVGAQPKRCLWEISKAPMASPVTAVLYIHKAGGGYSDDYVDLCKDFYLHM
ncbi:MAG: methyltransferase [Bacteroidales bacterium]|nr:methyltransferase [Bacteroidales bacterium]